MSSVFLCPNNKIRKTSEKEDFINMQDQQTPSSKMFRPSGVDTTLAQSSVAPAFDVTCFDGETLVIKTFLDKQRVLFNISWRGIFWKKKNIKENS